MSDLFKPSKCKFCRKDVLFDRVFGRVYEADKKTLHVENCERRQKFYHSQAMDKAEAKRKAKPS
jgi:hypothetical protein